VAPEGGGWSVPGFNCLNPGKDLVPIVQETRWATGLIWTTHNTPPRIRSPDHAVSSELLYQLYYPSCHKYVLGSEIRGPTQKKTRLTLQLGNQEWEGRDK
jgi:hypothetical protein